LSSTIDYLTLDDAFAAVDELGFVIVDPGLFASAVARPATTIFGVDAYPDLPTKAAALMHSVARNHALADGNKRTAWVLTRLMLALNGMVLDADEGGAETFVVAVAQGLVDVEDMAKWISDHSHYP
jgi:death on curing protein